MKKAAYIALALACVLSLSGCRDADRNDNTTDGIIDDDITSGDVTDSGNGEGLITDHDGSLNMDDADRQDSVKNNDESGRANSRRSYVPRDAK